MAATPPTPASPVGEDNWVDYIDQQARHAESLEQRIRIVELYRAAVNAEPGSITVWLAYCDYFWSLYQQCQRQPRSHSQSHGQGSESPAPGLNWSPEELQAGRDIFSLDTALHLWGEGHEATMYRLNDSHRLWDRWVSLEKELLGSSRTPAGIERITHLYRNRLAQPHMTWAQTSSMFSSFLSEYNASAYESMMQDVTERAKEAKRLYDERDRFEVKLRKAEIANDLPEQKAAMLEYINWEQGNSKRQRGKDQDWAIKLCLGAFSRGLTGLFLKEETVWNDYIVWVSTLRTIFTGETGKKKNTEDPDLLQLLPNALDILQRAALHCPWSGSIWARYILSGEEAGLAFHDMERIKHAATNSSELDRDGMTAVVDMYAAWCGYLKRTAMDPDATDESADIADSGLLAALEAVQVWGERRFGDEYQGDPSYRLERITIQYLTEKHTAIDDARDQWKSLAKRSLYANSYDFTLHYFMWEMMVFQLQKSTNPRSPTPGTAKGRRVPEIAAQVLERALHNPNLDWPERILEVYLHHCNDYQTPEYLRRALDTMHKTKKILAKRRERDAQNAAAAYAAEQPEAAAEPAEADQEMGDDSSSSGKRKRADQDAGEDDNDRSKRAKNSAEPDVDVPAAHDESQQHAAKRDRENCSILVKNLPRDATLTAIKKYFKEFGHINNATVKQAEDERSSIAFIEFSSPEDVRSAMIRDGKYFGESEISIKPATGMIIFVTNFPPTADEDFIKDLFKDCGPIFSVRWPSLKFNASRRFCYVTFLDPQGSAKAIKLHGRMLEDRYKLQVMYSEPKRKQNREGALEEGRELVVKNLAHSVDEAKLESVFGKFGELDRVRILRNVKGVSRGSGFVVFKTKEQAQKAIAELNDTKLENSIIKVELAASSNYKPSARFTKHGSPSPAPSNGDGDGDQKMTDGDSTSAEYTKNERTFALLDVPDTVNVARLRALVEEHGALVKLVLVGKQGGAIVEMEDIATVGKAQLSLEGVELDGQKIRTGTVAELFQKKPKAEKTGDTSAPPKKKANAAALMPPPPRVSRPALGGGGKRGLGYVGPKTVPKAPKTNGVADDGDKPEKKSNADFRNMFLGSGGDKAEKNTAEAAGDEKETPQNGH